MVRSSFKKLNSVVCTASPPGRKVFSEFSIKSSPAANVPFAKEIWNTFSDQLYYPLGVQPSQVDLTGRVITDQFRGRLPLHDHLYVARNLFSNARRCFSWSGRFAEL